MNELLLFAKAPRLGQVKTRLAKDLGDDAALQAYQRLLTEVANKLRHVHHGTICYTPADAGEELRPFFPERWTTRPQVGGDLGERLGNAIRISIALGAKRIAVIGADCPYLERADIENAWQLLDEHDLVIGPAKDGGYWLIAVKQEYPGLFAGIEWGAETVFRQTIRKAEELGLSVALIRELADIDTIADWEEFLGG